MTKLRTALSIGTAAAILLWAARRGHRELPAAGGGPLDIQAEADIREIAREEAMLIACASSRVQAGNARSIGRLLVLPWELRAEVSGSDAGSHA